MRRTPARAACVAPAGPRAHARLGAGQGVRRVHALSRSHALVYTRGLLCVFVCFFKLRARESPANGAGSRAEQDGHAYYWVALLTERCEGAIPGHAHDAALAAVCDEALGNHAFFESKGLMLTRELSVSFIRPVPLG